MAGIFEQWVRCRGPSRENGKLRFAYDNCPPWGKNRWFLYSHLDHTQGSFGPWAKWKNGKLRFAYDNCPPWGKNRWPLYSHLDQIQGSFRPWAKKNCLKPWNILNWLMAESFCLVNSLQSLRTFFLEGGCRQHIAMSTTVYLLDQLSPILHKHSRGSSTTYIMDFSS